MSKVNLDSTTVIILIDEDRKESSYAVCTMPKPPRHGPNEVLYTGRGSTDEVTHLAYGGMKEYNAKVICDVVPHGELQHIAEYQRWEIVKSKINKFQSVGFICGIE